MFRGVEREGEANPSAIYVLLIVRVHPLRSPNWGGVQVVVQSNGIVENYQIAEVEGPSHCRLVSPFWGSHDSGSGVFPVVALVENVVEVENEFFAWGAGCLEFEALGGHKGGENNQQEEEESRWNEKGLQICSHFYVLLSSFEVSD